MRSPWSGKGKPTCAVPGTSRTGQRCQPARCGDPSAQELSTFDPPKYFYVDEARTCQQCSQVFTFWAKEQKFWFTRYYKRLTKRLMNRLSSVVMPLDRIGYYDSSQR